MGLVTDFQFQIRGAFGLHHLAIFALLFAQLVETAPGVCGRLASISSVLCDRSSTDPDSARSGQVLLVGKFC